MATYLDNAGVTQILTKIKSLLAKKAEITAIPTKVSQLTNDRAYQSDDEVRYLIGDRLGEIKLDFKDVDKNENVVSTYYLSSISQDGGQVSATAVNYNYAFNEALKNAAVRNEVVSKDTVNGLINSAVGKITSFEYKVVSELPPESDGVKGTIYLLRHGGNDNTNSFDEYILVDTYSSGGITYSAHYEKIGTTDIDLTPYAKKTDIPTKVSQLSNDSSFATTSGVSSSISTAVNALTKSDTAETGKYVSAVSQKNGVITVTRENLPAVGTADSPISNSTIESIFTQVFG
nr:MAG TPA: hypothetical protein [Caudoviricetes sp.]